MRTRFTQHTPRLNTNQYILGLEKRWWFRGKQHDRLIIKRDVASKGRRGMKEKHKQRNNLLRTVNKAFLSHD